MGDTTLDAERGLDSQQTATPSRTRFYEQIPSADIFYCEFFVVVLVLTITAFAVLWKAQVGYRGLV